MNTVPQSLNNLIRSEPFVYSLHDTQGKIVTVFASSDAQTVAATFSEWVQFLKRGCVAILWSHGEINTSYGRESL